MIRWSIGEENIKLINIYVPHTGAPKYFKEILTDIKGEIDGNTIIVGDFYTTLTSMNRSSRQKINKARDLKWHNGKVRYNCYFQYITSKKNVNRHSFQVHMAHSQGLTTYWGTKLTQQI